MRQFLSKMEPEKKVAEIRHIVKAMKKNKRKMKNNILLINKYTPRTLNLISLALTTTLAHICRIEHLYGSEIT